MGIIKGYDGTDATVLPGSTSADGTETALVVALSPNAIDVTVDPNVTIVDTQWDDTNDVLPVVRKPLAGSTYSPNLYTYFAGAVTKANVKGSAGNVFSLVATNSNAAVRYLLLHNKATAPAAAEAGLVAFPIPAQSYLVLGSQWFTENGVAFGTGIGWSIGTTVASFTDSATASEHTVQITYK